MALLVAVEAANIVKELRSEVSVPSGGDVGVLTSCGSQMEGSILQA